MRTPHPIPRAFVSAPRRSSPSGLLPRGFTLVELMIVVVLIGLMAGLALPVFTNLTNKSTDTRFVSDLRVASHSLERYAMEKGDWPPDGAGGWPTEMGEYLPPPERWHQATPIGGMWSWKRGTDGFSAALLIDGYTGGEARAQRIDRLCDDGDLAAGNFRVADANLVYVMEQ